MISVHSERQRDILDLQDKAFAVRSAPKNKNLATLTLASAFTTKYSVMKVPSDMAVEPKRYLIGMWMMCLSRNDPSQSAWISLLLSLLLAVLPEASTFLSDSTVEYLPLTPDMVDQATALPDTINELNKDLAACKGKLPITPQGIILWDQLDVYKDEQNKKNGELIKKGENEESPDWVHDHILEKYRANMQHAHVPDSFPELTEANPGDNVAAIGSWLAVATEEVTIHGVISLMIFLAGKSINEENKSAIEQKRPAAIESKYNMYNNDLLTGKFKMSRTAHAYIHIAWTILNSFRYKFFEAISLFSYSELSLGQEVIWTTVKLMEYAGMQHTQLIMILLTTYPWAVNVPCLRSSAQSYLSSLRAFQKVDPHLRPFYKLMNGDKSVLFPRRTMEPLVAVAVHVLSEHRPEITQFYTTSGGRAAIDAFERYKADVQVHEEEGI